MDAATIQRFWSHVEKSDDCWLWTAAKSAGGGYGLFKANGKMMLAHRISYELEYGAIPAGLLVCHQCDTPACVRPDHFFLGTDQDNADDRDAKGRGAAGNRHWTRQYPERVLSGEQAPGAKLTAADVITIRSRLSEGHAISELAEAFGVNKTAISKIANRKTWKHLRRTQ